MSDASGAVETGAVPQAVANQPAAPDAPVPAPADQAEIQPQADEPELTPRETLLTRKDEEYNKMAREQASKKVTADARKGSVATLNPLTLGRKALYALAGKAIRQSEIKKFEKQYREAGTAYGDAQTQQDVDEATIARLKIQLEHGDLTEIDKIEAANNDVRQLIVDRVLRDYVNGILTGTPEAVQQEFQNRLTALVKDSQNKSSPGFTDAARDQIDKIFGKKAVASNRLADVFIVKELYETAKWMKDNVDAHKIAKDKIQEYVKFQLANPSWAASSEADLTTIDKRVRWVEENRFLGPLLSPTVVGVAFGIAASAGETLLTRAPGFIGRILAPVVMPLLGPIFGGIVSAVKRTLELKQNRAQLGAEGTYNEQTGPMPPEGKTLLGRLSPKNFSGEFRRADLEKFKYDRANATELRTTVDGLLGQNLSVPANRENLIKAVADIEARLNFSNREHIDLVTFESRGKVAMGRLQLIEAMALANQEIRNQLKTAGKTDSEIDVEMKRLTDDVKNPELVARYKHFTTDKTQQDKEFKTYMWRQARGAFVFGATAGLVSGIVTQEGLALLARNFHWGEGGGLAGLIFRKGETSAEKMFNAARGVFGQPEHNFVGGAAAGLSVDALKNLYEHPTNVAIPDKGIWLAVGDTHQASILDASGNKIPTPPMEVSKDGHLMILGKMDAVPQPIKDFLKASGWTEKLTSDPSFSLQEKMAHAYKMGTPGRETFRYGNFNIDLESGANHQMSMTLNPGSGHEVMVHGFLEMDATGHPNLNIDGSFNGNASLDTNQISLIKSELAKSGWPDPKIDHVHIPGKDQIVQVNEYLKSRGELQPTARELWHDNQTPMRLVNGRWLGADGKELQFYHRITPDGKIEMDFSKMESSFQNGAWRNWDATADNQYNRVVKDIVRQPDGSRVFNNFEIMITPNEQANSLREAVVFTGANHPELKQGFLRIDINSPEARAFFKLDENGKPLFNKFGNFQGASYIEVAHKQANNLRTILSTTQGEGVTQTIIPGEDIDYDVFHLAPPQATELIPPQPDMAPPIWIDAMPTRFQPLPPGEQGKEKTPPEKPGQGEPKEPGAPPPAPEKPDKQPPTDDKKDKPDESDGKRPPTENRQQEPEENRQQEPEGNRQQEPEENRQQEPGLNRQQEPEETAQKPVQAGTIAEGATPTTATTPSTQTKTEEATITEAPQEGAAIPQTREQAREDGNRGLREFIGKSINPPPDISLEDLMQGLTTVKPGTVDQPNVDWIIPPPNEPWKKWTDNPRIRQYVQNTLDRLHFRTAQGIKNLADSRNITINDSSTVDQLLGVLNMQDNDFNRSKLQWTLDFMKSGELI